ncbi:MAG: carbonic anhydrase [Caldilineales bacterium]|nr:carbonic anhydrase [Caldilineales bacterium]
MQANARYAEGFDQGHLASPPKRRVAVLTCMDARLHPESFLGLAVGDAHMIRNAGGRASDDAIRSLVISQRLLGTNEIVVIHHTDCGMAHFTNEQLAAKIKAELGVDVGDRDFLPFTDLEQSVRDDLNILRSSPLIPADVTIVGAIYDVRSGRLTEVARV